MTCVDSKARIWAYKPNDDYETPFWPPGDELSEIGQDTEYSTRSNELVEALEHVKKNPIPDKAIFENTPSLRPLSATSYGITVNRFENRVYQCRRVVDGARVNMPEGGWCQCTIVSSGTLYPCYCWVSESETQYLAWSLGCEEA